MENNPQLCSLLSCSILDCKYQVENKYCLTILLYFYTSLLFSLSYFPENLFILSPVLQNFTACFPLTLSWKICLILLLRKLKPSIRRGNLFIVPPPNVSPLCLTTYSKTCIINPVPSHQKNPFIQVIIPSMSFNSSFPTATLPLTYIRALLSLYSYFPIFCSPLQENFSLAFPNAIVLLPHIQFSSQTIFIRLLSPVAIVKLTLFQC